MSQLQINFKYTKTLKFFSSIFVCAGLLVCGVYFMHPWTEDTADALSETTNVTVDNQEYYITVSTAGDSIDLDAAATRAGSYSSVKDTVTVATNIPSGYSLYLSAGSTDPKLYLNGDSTSSSIGTTNGTYSNPQALQLDTYGYAIPSTITGAVNNNFDENYATPSPSSTSKWAALPVNTSQQLVQTTSAANTSGQQTDIYYATYLDNAVSSGTYQGSVTYTAMAEAVDPGSPAAKEASVYPTSGTAGEEVQLTIVTTLYTLADVGAVTVTLTDGTNNYTCNNPTPDTSTGVLVIHCTTSTTLTADTSHSIIISVPSYNKTFKISNAYFAKSKYMQDKTYTSWCSDQKTFNVSSAATMKNTTYTLYDSRTEEPYFIRKLSDGNCWMVENLYLTSAITLTPDDSHVSSNYTLPASTETGFSSDIAYMNVGGRNRNGDKSGDYAIDGSYFSWIAAKAGTSGSYNGVDICPKNWRLPSYSEAGVIADWGYTTFSNIWFADKDGGNNSSTPIYSGSYSSSGLFAGTVVYWWTNQKDSSRNQNPYIISSSNGKVSRSATSKSVGLSVRCLLSSS